MAGDMKFPEEVVKDFGGIPYNEHKGETIRARVVKSTQPEYKNAPAKLDVRVYVESDNYTGWTKKGFRLNREQAKALGELLLSTLEG